MEKKSADLVYKPEKVGMGQKELLVWETDPRTGRRCRTIPYETMVLVYLEVYDQETGKSDHPGDSGHHKRHEREPDYLESATLR